ncbi:hypothetical protein [Ulvibacterium marinum]|uniref:hypothetical protein n=1 Tax=Ulvibacterium marinum TaxID=2419782 RepID=UPI00249585D3|nr:hypothetical protein [Ulvibacterium marinum]
MKKTSSPTRSCSHLLLTITALLFLSIPGHAQKIFDEGVRINGPGALSLHPNVPFEIDEPNVVGGRFRVTTEGKVGIGAATPAYSLDVRSTSASGGWMSSFFNSIEKSGVLLGGRENVGIIGSHILNTQGTSSILVLNPDGGNVGIGTINPTEKLEVSGNIKATGGIVEIVPHSGTNLLYGKNALAFKAKDDNTQIRIEKGILSLHPDVAFEMDAANIVGGRFTIGKYGNVGIGVTAPTEKLEVNGNIYATGKIIADGGIQFGDGSEVIHFADNGHLGLGVSDPEHKLEVQGSAMVNEHLTVRRDAQVMGNLEVKDLEVTGSLSLNSASSSSDANLHITDYINSRIILDNGGTKRGTGQDVELVIEANGDDLQASIGTRNNRDLKLITNNEPRLWMNAVGDIGIGVEPKIGDERKGKLHVRGSFHVDNEQHQVFHVSGSKELVFVGTTAYDKWKQVKEAGNDASPHYNDFALWISDGLVTEKIVRRPATEWPDHVFDKDYDLPSLLTLANYIKINGHLPNIPSKAEVNQHGYVLHDLQYGFLKNLEELVLYTLAQEEKISDFEGRMQEYELEVAQLKATLEQLIRTK